VVVNILTLSSFSLDSLVFFVLYLHYQLINFTKDEAALSCISV
jgi:hypothetical protein